MFDHLSIILIAGVIAGIIAGMIAILADGLSGEMLGEDNLITPNQGIQRSATNALLVGLGSGLIFGLGSGLIFGLASNLTPDLGSGLTFMVGGKLYFDLGAGLLNGLLGGLVGGLGGGGLACIQHGVLRWLLWRSGLIPWDYVQFLDYAAERVLLRKVGGGYIFIHRLLLDYFASLM